jgi:hypothetical protein
MSGTNFAKGVSSFGVPVIGGGNGKVFGTTYFVDPAGANASDSNLGTDRNNPLKTLTQAFLNVSHWDTIRCAPGNYTGNYTTPNNATASFVTLIADTTHENGLAAWMGATVASSPIIDLKARGWSILGFEFDCPTSAGAINLNKSDDGSTDRPDFTTIAYCIFTTGKYGIVVDGGCTYAHIHHNRFDFLTTSGAFAIYVDNTSFHIPSQWLVEDNIFAENLNHIGPGNATYGWSDSTFRRNVFQTDSTNDVTTICDMRASGGVGNMFLDNYLDIATASWNTETNVRGNATDFAAGNHMNDGDQSTAMNVS